MTFYNIIFGILFLAVYREAAVALLEGRDVLWQLVSITLLLFNDTLFTAHAVESAHRAYKLGLKFIDLLNFMILTVALVSLAPEGNLLSIPAPHWLEGKVARIVSWGCVLLYWILCLVWTRLAGCLPKRLPAIPYLVLVLFAGRFALAWSGLDQGALRLVDLLVAVAVALYVFAYKVAVRWVDAPEDAAPTPSARLPKSERRGRGHPKGGGSC